MDFKQSFTARAWVESMCLPGLNSDLRFVEIWILKVEQQIQREWVDGRIKLGFNISLSLFFVFVSLAVSPEIVMN